MDWMHHSEGAAAPGIDTGERSAAHEEPASRLRVETHAYDGRELRVALELESPVDPRSLVVTVDGVTVRGVRALAGRQELLVRRRSHGSRTSAEGPQAGLIVATAEFDRGPKLGAVAEFDRPQRYRR